MYTTRLFTKSGGSSTQTPQFNTKKRQFNSPVSSKQKVIFVFLCLSDGCGTDAFYVSNWPFLIKKLFLCVFLCRTDGCVELTIFKQKLFLSVFVSNWRFLCVEVTLFKQNYFCVFFCVELTLFMCWTDAFCLILCRTDGCVELTLFCVELVCLTDALVRQKFFVLKISFLN